MTVLGEWVLVEWLTWIEEGETRIKARGRGFRLETLACATRLYLVARKSAGRAVVGRQGLLLGRVVGVDLGDTRGLLGPEREQAAAGARRG